MCIYGKIKRLNQSFDTVTEAPNEILWCIVFIPWFVIHVEEKYSHLNLIDYSAPPSMGNIDQLLPLTDSTDGADVSQVQHQHLSISKLHECTFGKYVLTSSHQYFLLIIKFFLDLERGRCPFLMFSSWHIKEITWELYPAVCN
jgi:hypothetical protein